MKNRVLTKKIILIALAVASALFVAVGALMLSPLTAHADSQTVYTYSKNSEYGLNYAGSQESTDLNSSTPVSRAYSITVSQKIYDELASNGYNRLVIAYGRKDVMDYFFNSTRDLSSGRILTPDSLAMNYGLNLYVENGRYYLSGGEFFSDCRYDGYMHNCYPEIKTSEKTGTFDYIEINKGKNNVDRINNNTYTFNYSWAENNLYDIGVYFVYYYSTSFGIDYRSELYFTDTARTDIESRVSRASEYPGDVVGAYEKALGIYRSGNTNIQYHYLKMQDGHFNKFENCTGSISVPSVYVPDTEYIKSLVLKSDYVGDKGLIGYNAVYESVAGYTMSNGNIGTKETFGSRVIRQATGLTYSYTGGQIPETVSVNVDYANYRYSDFFIKLSNSGDPDNPDYADKEYIDNDLCVDIYPTSIENKDGRYYLYFDYDHIFDLFNNTLFWAVEREDFILTYDPADVQDGVSVEETKLESGSNGLIVSFQDGYESRLFGLEITGNVPITPPEEMNCTVEYLALNDDLTVEKRTFSAGVIMSNTYGEFEAELLNPEGAYKDYIYGELSATALNGIDYLLPDFAVEVEDFTTKTVRFSVQYKYNTSVLVVENNLNSEKWIFELSGAASEYTLKELGVEEHIPSGYRISSFTGNRIQIVKETKDRFNELNTVFRRGDNDSSEPFKIYLTLTDKWPIKINYLEQWKESPFAELKEFNGEIRVADYPDLLNLTGEDVSSILGQDIVVLKFIKVAIKIDTVITTYDETKDAYVVDLTYSYLSFVSRDKTLAGEEIKIAMTPFSMWCEFFGKDWSILFLNADKAGHHYFDFSNDVPTDKLYGFFSYVVYKDQVHDLSEWLRDFTNDGVSVVYNYQEVKGSWFYEFLRKTGPLFTAAGATAGLFFGHPIVGAAVGTVGHYGLETLSEIINNDNGTYYTYFFFLDGTTEFAYASDVGSDSRDDTDSALVNKLSGWWDDLWHGDSTGIIIFRIFIIIVLSIIAVGILYKLIRKIFFNK